MLKQLIVSGAGLACLAACGGGGEGALIAACMDEGETRKNCTCVAAAFKEELSPEAFEVMVLDAQGQEDKAQEAAKDLTMTDAMAMAGAALKVSQQCDVAF